VGYLIQHTGTQTAGHYRINRNEVAIHCSKRTCRHKILAYRQAWTKARFRKASL